MMLTFEEWFELDYEQRLMRYGELNNHDRFRARVGAPLINPCEEKVELSEKLQRVVDEAIEYKRQHGLITEDGRFIHKWDKDEECEKQE